MSIFGGKIKSKIISDLKSISNLDLLNQILEILRVAKLNEARPKSNRNAVLSFAGSIQNQDASEIKGIVDNEFNQIEGYW